MGITHSFIAGLAFLAILSGFSSASTYVWHAENFHGLGVIQSIPDGVQYQTYHAHYLPDNPGCDNYIYGTGNYGNGYGSYYGGCNYGSCQGCSNYIGYSHYGISDCGFAWHGNAGNPYSDGGNCRAPCRSGYSGDYVIPGNYYGSSSVTYGDASQYQQPQKCMQWAIGSYGSVCNRWYYEPYEGVQAAN